MTISLLHSFVSAISDDAAAATAGKVVPSNWNHEHSLRQATGKLLGRTTAATGVTEEISVSSPLTFSSGALGINTGTSGATLPLLNTSCGWSVTVSSASSSTVQGQKFTNTINIPSTSTDSLNFGFYNLTYLTGSAALAGSGHALGILSEFINQSTVAQPLFYGAQTTVRNDTGAGAVTKMVGHAYKVDNPSSSTIALATALEIIIQANAGTITNFVGLTMADFSAITGITNRWFAKCDDPNALIQTAGKILGAYGKELAPIHQGGYKTGNYYHLANPYALGAGPFAFTAGNAYGVPFVISERTTFTKIGCRVTTAAAAGKLVKFPVFKVANGVLAAQVVDSGTVAADSTGDKEATISWAAEPGPYVAFVQTDGTPTLNMSTDFGGMARGFFGSASSTSVGGLARLNSVGLTTVGDNPGSFDVLDGVDVVPDIWLRK